MLTDKQIQALRSENELLQIQLDDVNMVIGVREEELELLRARAKEAAAMQSRLDNNLNEFDQMQRSLGDEQQKNSGNLERLEEMENELYDSVKEQIRYADSLKDFNSMQAKPDGQNNELQEAGLSIARWPRWKQRLRQRRATWRLALDEIDSLKESWQSCRPNTLLLQKKIGYVHHRNRIYNLKLNSRSQQYHE